MHTPTSAALRALTVFLAIIALSGPALSHAAETAPAPAWVTPVTTVEGISEYRLPNGFRVLLLPDPSSANFAATIVYFVGSRHEGRGEKGMAHLLEHMLFKGSTLFADPSKSLKEHGAQSNASTWTDRTIYFESMVASDENLEFTMKFEADRMLNSFIEGKDLATEMTVVRNEFEMNETDPFNIMLRSLFARAYTWHPYRDSTIGNRSDIERVPADNLRRFYKEYYRPANALMVVAGGIDVQKTLDLIDKYFSPLANPPEPIVDTWTEEPTQDGARSFEVRRDGSQASVGVLYHAPAGAHPDSAALEFFNPLLSDVPWGRLHKALIETNLAASASVLTFGMAERGQVLAIATLKEGQDPAKALATIQEVMEGFATAPVTDLEVDRARASLLTQIKHAHADNLEFAYDLAQKAAIGDWRFSLIHRDRIKSMKTQDVQSAAIKYFVPSSRTSGTFLPTKTPIRAEIPAKPDIAALVRDYKGSEPVSVGEAFDPSPANIEARTTRSHIGEAIQLAALPKKTRGQTAQVVWTVRFGDDKSLAGTRVTGELLASMLGRGTKNRTFQQHSDELDQIQSNVSVSWQDGLLRFDISSDRPNLSKAVEIAGDMLRNPTFPESEFRAMLVDRIGGAESQLSQPTPLAWNALQRAVLPFPKESSLYTPTVDERLAITKSLTVEEVRRLYTAQVGPASVQIAAVGDFDPRVLTADLKKVFDGWSPRETFKRIERPFRPVQPGLQTILTPDKPMATVGLATTFRMSDNDPDAPALRIAVYILGRGLHSRLGDRLREKEGLSYDMVASLAPHRIDPVASLIAYAICAKQNAQRTAAILKEEIVHWIDDGITETELAEAKKGYRLAITKNFSDDSTVADILAEGLYLGRTLKWNADLLDKVDALTPQQVNDALKRQLAGAPLFEVQVGDLEPREDNRPHTRSVL